MYMCAVHICGQTRACMCARMCEHAQVCIYVYMHMCVRGTCMCIRGTCVHVYACMWYTCRCTWYTCTCVCVCSVCVHDVHICVCIYVCTHVHCVCAYGGTFRCIWGYTCTCVSMCVDIMYMGRTCICVCVRAEGEGTCNVEVVDVYVGRLHIYVKEYLGRTSNVFLQVPSDLDK